MSRTRRRHRPRMKLGHLVSRQYKDGTVRDGTPQYYSSGCEHHGDCPHCLGNRTFSSRKREPIVMS